MTVYTVTIKFEDNRDFTLNDIPEEVLAYIATLEEDGVVTVGTDTKNGEE